MWMPHCHIARLPQHLSSDPLLGRGCHNDAPLRITARHREYIGLLKIVALLCFGQETV